MSKYGKCKCGCGVELTRSKQKFSRTSCEDTYYNKHPKRRRPKMDDGVLASMRTARILNLQAEIERTNISWEKQELIAKLRELQAQKT